MSISNETWTNLFNHIDKLKNYSHGSCKLKFTSNAFSFWWASFAYLLITPKSHTKNARMKVPLESRVWTSGQNANKINPIFKFF